MTQAPLEASDLDYELPAELVAQHPAPERGGSRLMVLDAGDARPRVIGRFDELLLDQLRDDDLVVANDARVLHARIPLRRDTGGAGEVLLLAPTTLQPDDATRCRWTAMARPARKYRAGGVVPVVHDAGNGATITFVERVDSQTWVVDVPCALGDVPAWMRRHGELPLPPYVVERGQDEERYQTVHARVDGSIAAPTAGLHFDDVMWQRVAERCQVAQLTLHVGAGTFLPVGDGPLDTHAMHGERYELPGATDAAIQAALADRRRIVAVGTTTARVLEHIYGAAGVPRAGSTNLFILPGHRWSCVGALLTNLHLPRSTLIALVMAFMGEEPTRGAYARAVEARMRFYSFGDAMFIHGSPISVA